MQVLVDEHRARLQELDDLAAHPARLREETDVLDQLTLDVAAHLVGEEVIIEPVVTRVLSRDGFRDEREMDIRFCIRTFARAGIRRAEPDVVADVLRDARAVYQDLTSRTEVEVLPYLHYVFDDREKRRLAEIYPTICEESAAGYRQEQRAGQPSWEDADLVRRLRRLHTVVLQRMGPPKLRDERGVQAVRATREGVRRSR